MKLQRLLLPLALFLVLPVRGRAAGSAPAGTDADAPGAALKRLPPFLGLFGSADLIARHGFHAKAGSYLEYEVSTKGPSPAGVEHMRIAEVGPEVPGARWIEITTGMGGQPQGMRLLARGNKNGNIERLIVSIGGMPPMEMPLQAVSEGGTALVSISGQMLGAPRKLRPETIDTPLGKFKTDHYQYAASAQHGQLDLWVTKDPRVPFVGIVKMITAKGGIALLSKVGTDATATISLPHGE